MGAEKNINNIITEYLQSNVLLKSNVVDEYISVKTHQDGLATKYNSPIINSEKDIVPTSPLNNINFTNSLMDGFNDQFKNSAFYLLSSLQSETNTFIINKKNLTILFKSGLGIMDLPYSLVLYLGGLHYFNKTELPDKLKNISNFYQVPVDLDGNTALNIDPNNLELAKNYDIENDFKVPYIPLLNDSNYRSDYESNFIPKFGYGTLSKFMNYYYEFISDKYNSIHSGYSSYGDQPFHIFGAENGFVKSFKTYSDDNINFMGHYTILKNSYNFPGFEDSKTLKDQFIAGTVGTIDDNILSNYSTRPSGFKEMFLVYSKLKTGYLYKSTDRNTDERLLSFIKALNDSIPTKYTYSYK